MKRMQWTERSPEAVVL